MSKFLYYFIVFFSYSVIGWFIESTYVSIKSKKIINRGFLIGPYCPIYGFGALVMIIYLEQYKNNLVTVFILATVICSILEYFTSFIMEKLFKTRWWDYSHEKFNLNGRICGKNAILFGLGGVIIIYIAHPLLKGLFECINTTLLLIITITCLIIYFTDIIISFNVMNRFKKTVTSLDLKKDSTQDFNKMVSEVITNHKKIFQKRLYTAFPDINLNRLKEFSYELKTRLKK